MICQSCKDGKHDECKECTCQHRVSEPKVNVVNLADIERLYRRFGARYIFGKDLYFY